MLVVFFGYPIFLFMIMRMFLTMDTMNTAGQLICNEGHLIEMPSLAPIGLTFKLITLHGITDYKYRFMMQIGAEYYLKYFFMPQDFSRKSESPTKSLSRGTKLSSFKRRLISKLALIRNSPLARWVFSYVCLSSPKSFYCSGTFAVNDSAVPSLEMMKKKINLRLKKCFLNKLLEYHVSKTTLT